MKLYKVILSVVVLGMLGACGTKTPTTSGGGPKEYEEDLSQFVLPYTDSLQRLEPISPSPEIQQPETPDEIIAPALNMELAITDSLDILLDSITVKNKDNLYRGYTIQVYSGSDRQAANEAKNKLYQVLPSSQPNVSYIQPNFKVRVGEFVDRLEAQKMYIKIKEAFPGALLIPKQIRIN